LRSRWASRSVPRELEIMEGQIHRHLLASNGSAFGAVFSLPNGENAPDSTAEDEPLILRDNVDEFRALCWALYALYVHLVLNRVDDPDLKL